MSFSRIAAARAVGSGSDDPSASSTGRTSNGNGSSVITTSTITSAAPTTMRKPRVADIMGGPKRRSQPPPVAAAAKPKKEHKVVKKAAVPSGGDGDDDGDDDAAGAGDHDEGPYIFQASRPKDAPQYRMSKSIFNHRGGIRMDMITGAMLQLGWTEEPDAESLAFDLQWALSAKHLQRERLKPKQIINHFQGIGCVTTKIQLCKNLRTLAKPHCDTFFPRCYAVCESKEFDAFVKQYQSQAAISILIKYMNLATKPSSSSSSSSSSSTDSKSDYSSSSSPSSSSPSPSGQPVAPLLTRTIITLALHAVQAHIKKMRYSPIARDVSWKEGTKYTCNGVPAVSSPIAPVTEEVKSPDPSGEAKGKVAKKTGGVYRRSNDLSRVEWQGVVRCAESLRPHANTVAAKKAASAASTAATTAPDDAAVTSVTVADTKTNGNATTTPSIVPAASPSASNGAGAAAASPVTDTTPTSAPKPTRQLSNRSVPVARRSGVSASTSVPSNEPTGVTPVVGPLFDDKLIAQVSSAMEELKELDPQYYYNGEFNVWILKPGTQSRGRGIQVCDSLPKIVREMRADVSGRWVIQKYLERPMAIHRKKFDIRQWMVVTQFGTSLRAWFYEDCYLRFSSQDFDLSDLSGGIHLTNNAIQAKLKEFDNGALHQYGIKGNMWSMNQFAAWLETTYGSVPSDARVRDPLVEGGGGDADGMADERQKYSVWHHKLRPKMRSIAQSIMETARDRIIPRSHSFEIYGLDFMFDENMQPWLLEVNSAPTLMHIAVDGLVDTMCLDMLTVVLADHHRMLNEEAAEAVEKAKADASAAATAATAAASASTSSNNGRTMQQRGAASPTNRGKVAAAKKTMIARQSSKPAASPRASAAVAPMASVAATTSTSVTSAATTESAALPPLDIIADTASSSTSTDAAAAAAPSSTSGITLQQQQPSTAAVPTTSTLGALAVAGSKFRLIYEHRLSSRERPSKAIARMRAFKDSYNANRSALTQPGSVQHVSVAQHLL